MTIVLKATSDTRSRLLNAVAIVKNTGILSTYRLFYEYYRDKTEDRYLQAALETPFAPSSIGLRRPSGDTITPDSLFGIDTEALFRDFTQNVKITADGIEIYSDLPYARRIESLFQEKGPFAPNGVLFVDDEDLDELELIAAEQYQKGLGQLPSWL